MKLELVATYVDDSERLAIIHVRHSSPRREEVFRVGGKPLPSAVITSIMPRRVYLVLEGQQSVSLEMGTSVSPHPPEDDRSEQDNLSSLLTQVNIHQVFQAGHPAGFRLTDIQKGTILDQIGLQDGDTLRSMNGHRIDSVQSAYQAYNLLRSSTKFEIIVLRNARPVTLRYPID